MKNSYLNTVLSTRSRITPERLVQFTFLTLEEHYVNFMKEFDYFMYKDFENLLKRSVKICDMLLLLSPQLNISFKSKKFDIVVDKFNFHLDAVQKEFKLDIDNVKQCIKDIEKEYKFCMYMYYYLEMIKKHTKNIENEIVKNHIKGYILVAKKIQNRLYNDLKSDKIFIGEWFNENKKFDF